MALQNFSTFFTNVNDSIIDTATQLVPLLFGLAPSIRNKVDPKYLVRISSSTVGGGGGGYQPWTIEATLQEKIKITTTSEWSNVSLFPEANKGYLAEAVAATGWSLANTFSSRRRWVGSSPIIIDMKLRFEAEVNAWSEVTKACAKLQGLTCPTRGLDGLGGSFFLRPPGPNPWNLNWPGEIIFINIGNGWLTFNNVIVNEVTTDFENRMSANGPIGATVNIRLSTYELITKEGLEKAYGANIFGPKILTNTPVNTTNVVTSPNSLAPTVSSASPLASSSIVNTPVNSAGAVATLNASNPFFNSQAAVDQYSVT